MRAEEMCSQPQPRILFVASITMYARCKKINCKKANYMARSGAVLAPQRMEATAFSKTSLGKAI